MIQSVLLCFLLSVCSFIHAEESEQPLEKGTAYVYLQGTYPLRPQVPLFNSPELSRTQGRALIEKALATRREQIVIDCTHGAFFTAATAEAFASCIRQQRHASQKIACLFHSVSDVDLILASACDETLVIQAHVHQVDGLALYMDYYADALEKIGIKFNAVTSGPEKTGPEFITHSKPSEAALAEAQKLLTHIDANLIGLSMNKKITAAQIKTAREQSPQTSEQLLASGLADKNIEVIAWRNQLPRPLKTISSKDKSKQDLSSFTGMMAFWGQLMRGPQDTKADAFIAVLELEGSIFDGEGEEPGVIAALSTVEEMKNLQEDKRVKAVLIRINSGGGSASASDRIYHALKSLAQAKPCLVLIDDVAASGGYYIACAAPFIMAHNSSITGSIGVFAMMPDLTAMRTKMGINRHVLSSSKRATVMDTGAFDENKRAAVNAIIEDVDKRFQGIVAQERKLDPAAVAKLADGKIYLAREALDLGLINATGDYAMALAALAERSGHKNLPVERFPAKKGLAEMLGLGMQMWMPPSLRGLIRLAKRDQIQVFCWRQLPTLR